MQICERYSYLLKFNYGNSVCMSGWKLQAFVSLPFFLVYAAYPHNFTAHPGFRFVTWLSNRSHLVPLSTVMKYSSYHPAAIDPEADSEEEEEDDSDDGCCGMREHLPHWSCCMWFFIVVIAAMLVSEVLAWLRQPSCGGHSHFEWNQVIPANTVNQIERGNLGSMLQEYDILGVLEKSSFLVWTKILGSHGLCKENVP